MGLLNLGASALNKFTVPRPRTENAFPDMPLIIPCYKFAQNAQPSRENVQLREIGAEFRGQDSANSLYFSLLAGNLGRKVSARLLPLPFSLHCREISPN